jgi:hypothetical protein
MVDRSFNEADLREMLENATGYRPDDEPGRWLIETSHRQAKWEVVVEPQDSDRVLVVVTAYPLT